MADTPDSKAQDWRSTVFLPKTDFPMKAGLAAKEPAILAKWEADDLYGTLRRTRAGRDRFLLHDGPPYANGDIHMGHAMNKVLKDIIVRSQSLLGKDAPYVPGWDCHGLPIEWKVEERYRAKKLNKDEVPVAQFRAECRAYAETWVAVQREQFKRLGVMGDWADPYLTMKYDAEATIAAELLKFAETGQLYRGAKPVMWSPVEKTALAEAEVEYEDITSTQIDVAFEIVSSPIKELEGVYAVIWTTTPWTIPVNQALAYSSVDLYMAVEVGDRVVVVARSLLDAFLNRSELEITKEAGALAGELIVADLAFSLAEFKMAKGDVPGVRWYGFGSDLAGTIAHHPMAKRFPDNVFLTKDRPFLPGDFVTTDAGTGLVHMAPDHGEDDFLLCKANGLEPVFAVEGDGRYRADWPWVGGLPFSVIDKKLNAPEGPICSDLSEVGALLSVRNDESTKHSYPHSWRSKAKVIFRATPQWFIAMDKPIGADLPSRLWEGSGVGASEASSLASLRSAPPPSPLPQAGGGDGNAPTLRELALDAIEVTRWVPEKSRNRIHAMVAGRPDWVISRQRAWGVPIALYVDRRSGDYLNDPEVNKRIVAAFAAGGADAWFTADHAALLGLGYDLADWEPQKDILDVWFDSGCTHAFTIEARYGANPDGSPARADLYLEGSDQHRGWFQSSLLESCGTRGHAPYAAVLTHGFALDGQGRKMSKSIGNVVDPLKIIGESGADILRLWVASTDYFDDVRIGKEVLAGTSDTYRKLRNTFRYLLGALEGYSETEWLPVAEMPELERYMLHLLAMLNAELKDATQAFEFNRYARALTDFCNNDLSAFFFDIRKDSLYCDAADDAKRRAYRTTLDILFHALVRYAAPILCFTAEEVWGTRFPEGGSVHLLEWPEVDAGWRNDDLRMKWAGLRLLRTAITGKIEPLRRDKEIGSSLEAEVAILTFDVKDQALFESADLAELVISSAITVQRSPGATWPEATTVNLDNPYDVKITKTNLEKCGRCWRHLPEVVEEGALCARCEAVVRG